MTETKIKNLKELLEQAKTYEDLQRIHNDLFFAMPSPERDAKIIAFNKSQWVSAGLVERNFFAKELSLRKSFKDIQTALDEFPKWCDWKDNPNLVFDWQSNFKAILWSVKKEVLGK